MPQKPRRPPDVQQSRPARPGLLQPQPDTGAVGSRGEMRRRSMALLQEHPEGLTPAEMRDRLGVGKNLGDTLLGMLRYGLVQRVGRGRYVAVERPTNE